MCVCVCVCVCVRACACVCVCIHAWMHTREIGLNDHYFSNIVSVLYISMAKSSFKHHTQYSTLCSNDDLLQAKST